MTNTHTNGYTGKTRQRCYSSMNFIEYESYFGVAPKVPDTPNAKL